MKYYSVSGTGPDLWVFIYRIYASLACVRIDQEYLLMLKRIPPRQIENTSENSW